jgi:hypothetical protein
MEAMKFPPSGNGTVLEKLKMFADLDAYAHVKDVEIALDDYWEMATTLKKVKRGLPTLPPVPRYRLWAFLLSWFAFGRILFAMDIMRSVGWKGGVDSLSWRTIRP